MKLKNLILLSAFVTLFTMFLGTSSAYAQDTHTWYVDNLSGNDSWDGHYATSQGDGIRGPKKTIAGGSGGAVGAVKAAVASDIIYIANTGVAYNTGDGEPSPIVIDKQLTLRAYVAGTPSSSASVTISPDFTLNNATGTSPANQLTFDSGTFVFAGTNFKLTAGVIAGGNNITVGATTTTITRTAGSVGSGQLNYAGTINFVYDGAAAVATGYEFPAAGGLINNLTTLNAGTVLTIDRNVSLAGALSTSDDIRLGTTTITIGNGSANTIGGNVVGGTLDFYMNANASLTGAFRISNLKARINGSTGRTLSLVNVTDITGTLLAMNNATITSTSIDTVYGSVTAQNSANITLNSAATLASGLTNSGTGVVTTAAVKVVGDVILNTTGIAPTAANGGLARIVFTTAGALAITGNVTNQAAFTFADDASKGANTDGATGFARFNGVIELPDQAITIGGNVLSNNTFGSVAFTAAGNAIKWNGLIVFKNRATNLTITGSMSNTSSLSGYSTAKTSTFTDNGLIIFPYLVSGTVRVDGGITNSSSFAVSGVGAGLVDNGVIDFDYADGSGLGGATLVAYDGGGNANGALITGTHVVAASYGLVGNPLGAVLNNSASRADADGNGDIIFATASTVVAPVFASNITVNGTAVGGNTVLPNGNLSVTGNITNSRTAATSSLFIGTTATSGVNIAVGGNIVNSGTGTTVFNSFLDGTFVVTGKIESTANGTIQVAGTPTGTFTIGTGTPSVVVNITNGNVIIPGNLVGTQISINGSLEISGGALNLAATAGNVVISGTGVHAYFLGGTINVTGRTNLTIQSKDIKIGSATTNPTFTGAAANNFIAGTPLPADVVTVTFGSLQPSFPGTFQVNTTTGIVTAAVLTGGLFKPAVLNLNAGYTNINGAIINLTQAGAALVNTSGYYSTNQGRVVLSGTANQTISGAGKFGDIEVTNTTGAPSVSVSTAVGDFTGTIYLTQGQLDNSAHNINFNNASSYPTIVVNQGTLAVQPTFTSKVNVIYVGIDKTTGNELPAAADKLNDLIVATTNGAAGTGQGSVIISQSAQVNGTLKVNAGQTLVIANGQTLSLNGATANVLGNITNIATGNLQFVAPWPGTAVTATGYLPQVVVANGSHGNSITGAKALINGLLGADGIVAGVADYSLAAASHANAPVSFATKDGSLTLAMAASPFDDGTQVDGINTVVTGGVSTDTLTLAANLTNYSSNSAAINGLNHNGGVINVGTSVLTELDANPTITGGAKIIGSGSFTLANSGAVLLSLVTSDVTIDANVVINPATSLTIDPANAGNLILTGNVSLASGSVVLGSAATARNITLKGATFTQANGTSFDATALGALIFNAATAPLVWTNANTATTVPNITVLNDVSLAGAVTGLTVGSTLTLTSGVLNQNAVDVTVASAGLLTRGAHGTGTISQTTGYLVLNNATVATGDGAALSVDNLRFAGTASTFTSTAGNLAFAVNKKLDIANSASATTNLLNTVNNMIVAANTAVKWTAGKFNQAPAYATPISLNLSAYATGDVVDATVWPNNKQTLVSALSVNGTNAADIVKLPLTGTRTAITALNLTKGVLELNGTTLNLNSGINVTRTDASQITTVAGTLTFPSDNIYNLTYYANSAAITSGIELPAVLNKLTLSRSVNTNNFATTIGKTITVNDALTINNDIIQVAPFILAANGNITIGLDSYVLATTPSVSVNSFKVGGTNTQNLVLTGNVVFPNFTVQMQGVNPILNVTGSFSIPPTSAVATKGTLTFVNGIINMTSGTLYLPRPQDASNSGLGFSRDLLTGVGHVVGNVARSGNANDGQTTDGRFVFPTGTLPDAGGKTYYRPITFTFTQSYPLGSPTTIVVNHKNLDPQGSNGFPMDGGNGVTIGKYPTYYWDVYSTPAGLTQGAMYDVEMQGTNLGYPYTSYANLRAIRRLGNTTSQGWTLLTTDGDNNAQQVFGTDTTVWVRSTATQGGILSTASRFTIGIPVLAPAFTVPTTNPAAVTIKEGAPSSLPFTVATNLVGGTAPAVTWTIVPTPANDIAAPAIVKNTASGVVSGNITWTPGFTASTQNGGSFVVTITATDAGGTSSTVYNVTVADSNRAPVLTASSPVVSASPKVGVATTLTYNATDQDNDVINWAKAINPAPAGTVTATAATGNQYVITFTPAFADLGKAFKISATLTDSKSTPITKDTTLAAVALPAQYGDITMDGTYLDGDAVDALAMSVGYASFNGITFQDIHYALADVDNNHTAGYVHGSFAVSAYDAYKILWKSLDPTHNLLPIEGGPAKSAPATGELSIGKRVAVPGSELVSVPLQIADAKNVNSVTYEISYDTKLAEVTDVKFSTPKDWLTAYKIENGVVKIVMAGLSSVNVNDLASLTMKMKSKDANVTLSGTAKINDLESKTLAPMSVGEIPASYSLSQNYPNPFNPSTTIRFALPATSHVKLSIYSIDGQLVKTLVDDSKDAGNYSVVWNGTNNLGSQVASGMYIYRIDAGNFVNTKKLMLMK